MNARRPEPPATPRRATALEIQDALTLLDASAIGMASPTPRAVSVLEICRQILGFDPSAGQKAAAYGGKSTEGWYGQYMSVGRIRASLQDLVEAGVVTEIVGKDDRSVRTPYRASPKGRYYLLTARHEESTAIRGAELRDRQRKALRAAEERDFIATHAAEIQAGYEARCAAVGISPTLETTEAGPS
jgi:DNA-binding PadR family transcriptional regulator